MLEAAMIHGAYPEVRQMTSADQKARHLRQLVAAGLLKDIFAHVDVNRRSCSTSCASSPGGRCP